MEEKMNISFDFDGTLSRKSVQKYAKELTNDSNRETCNKKSNKKFKDLDKLCFLSKNLYNSALYSIRQSYFETKEYTNYYAVVSKFTKENQIDYRSLPSKVSQQTLKMVDQNFKSFFACLLVLNLNTLMYSILHLKVR